jgi:phosphoribosylformimino-5-aminoimidazole carboxamide ribotide isomerase
MLNLTIIPAIDLIGGKCVRLTRGDYSSEKVYSEDPLNVAKAFEAAGAKRLHLVDLDGAKASQPQNLKTLEAIASQTGLEVEFGGGIKSDKSLKAALDAGAGYIVCGSVAVTNSDMAKSWMESYGSRIILGIDVRNGLVATRGWLESSRLSAEDLLESYGGLISEAEITEISRDGTLQGIDAEFYSRLQRRFPKIRIIASGGVSGKPDLEALERAGIGAVIVGKAIYEGRIKLEEIF